MENVYITPHVAASSDVKALFAHVEQQIARFESGLSLEHLVDQKPAIDQGGDTVGWS